ncbi:MAG: hypothetical protein LBR55_01380 [Bacteroidales bacterium]|jgi:hypothetical protein|nr:hypothetical protein [Bacteroidales bacterium]
MKKIIYAFVAFSCVCSVAFAQQEEKRMRIVPEGYMPAGGDISLGFTLNPLNIGVGGTAIDNKQEPFVIRHDIFSIMGKYQLDDVTALRANIGFKGRSVSNKTFVQDDKAVTLDPLSVAQVEDVHKLKVNGASFAIGAEKQRTYRNVRGFAGVSALYAFSKEKNTYTYGNAITEINQTPSQSQPSQPNLDYLENARELKTFGDNTHALGLVGHVGVEWFFSPKVSLGGEVNMSFLYQWNPRQHAVYEGWNPVTKQVEEYTDLLDDKSSGFYYGTDNLGANLSLNFYF